MRLALAFLAAAVVSRGPLAADNDPIKSPYVEVGDCWTYRAVGLFHHGWIDEYRECVTYVDRPKNLILALATVKGDGREIETAYSLDWGDRTPIDGQYNQPQADFLRFPLRIGEAYTVSFDFTDTQSVSSRRNPVRWEMKVIGWEEISVPAGKFAALRVEGRAFWNLGSRDAALARTIWYVPEINRAAKWSYSRNVSSIPLSAERLSVELVNYQLNR